MDKNTWSLKNRRFWKEYLYDLIAAEISTTTRFSDECIQVNPQAHDTGLLFEAIDCRSKRCVNGLSELYEDLTKSEKRRSYIFNGNFNYNIDIQEILTGMHDKISRHSRLFVVIYNPFLNILYNIASWLKIRQAPKPTVYFTEKNLDTLAKLSGYSVTRIRPSVFIPFRFPLISNFINKLLPIIPIIRRTSFVWIVVLRPIKIEITKPSLSIIIPARNEAGNIKNAVQRIPQIPGSDTEIIFVEGNSSDDTWNRIQQELKNPSQTHKMYAYKQPGIGKNDAVRVGFDNATGDLVTILDADLTMPPEMLPRFYNAYCKGLGDFINGSRLIYPMEDEAMRPLNRLGNLFFCKLLAWTLDIPITDSLCGTKLFALEDYKRMISWRESFGDFDPFGDFEMLFSASELALGVIDIPVQYQARTYGDTNISRFRNGWELARMTLIGFHRILLGKTK
ncbi:glycosyltransferase family 2 protein [Thermodesulfobacteriota bacterium]